jgi:hypothetical protein
MFRKEKDKEDEKVFIPRFPMTKNEWAELNECYDKYLHITKTQKIRAAVRDGIKYKKMEMEEEARKKREKGEDSTE